MEYYNLRKAGKDVDLIVTKKDYQNIYDKYPDSRKELWADFGIIFEKFEI